MPGNIHISGLQGWLNQIFGTVWTYWAIGLFFAAVLSLALLHSFCPGIFPSRKRSGRKSLLPAACFGGRETDLLDVLQAESASPKTVLLAAAGLDCLPVTIPIRLALQVSRTQRRCLLIDLDTKRDAVWKAFGKGPVNGTTALPAESGLENLSLIPAHYFNQTRQMNLAPLLRRIQHQYDLILINAPYLDGHPDRNMIASWAQYAFIFAKENNQAQRLAALCQSRRCKILGCYKSPSPASSESSPSSDAASASTSQVVL